MYVRMNLTTGDTVRPSNSEIQRARDYWLNQGDLGKSARVELQRKIGRRGAVTDIRKEKSSTIYTVRWSDGATSECLSYVLQKT
jgi:hypothetical protein